MSNDIELPDLPELPDNEVIPYSAIRYVNGYAKSFIHEYAQAYARAAILADREKRAQAARGWLPIETAPKDRTEILACWPKRKLDDDECPTGEITGYAQCVTAWQGFWIEPDYLEAHGSFYFEDEAFADEPTHWMPLPSAPTEASKPVQAEAPHSDLMKFYGVDNLSALVEAQHRHIEKLQAKLPRNDQPAFTRVREG